MHPLLQGIVLAFAFAASSLGCATNDEPCNRFVHDDEKFEVTVLGPSDPTIGTHPSFVEGLPSCGLDDIHAGDRHLVTLSERMTYGGETGCQEAVCPRDFPVAAPAIENSTSPSTKPSVCLAHNTKVQLSSQCEFGRFVALYYTHYGSELYPETNGGVTPSFTLLRALSRTGGRTTCDEAATFFPSVPADNKVVCADLWQVTLAKR